MIIAGDFNFNLLNYDKDQQTEIFLDMMLANFFQPHIIQPSRALPNKTPSLINDIFINSI